mmetsp:Transcript_68050/g.120380  ORF Transcript_68050/g.120380 Transcript_68050/m.120380 type:complete len:238 (-) Transcript_68050:346-1059(-)
MTPTARRAAAALPPALATALAIATATATATVVAAARDRAAEQRAAWGHRPASKAGGARKGGEERAMSCTCCCEACWLRLWRGRRRASGCRFSRALFVGVGTSVCVCWREVDVPGGGASTTRLACGKTRTAARTPPRPRAPLPPLIAAPALFSALLHSPQVAGSRRRVARAPLNRQASVRVLAMSKRDTGWPVEGCLGGVRVGRMGWPCILRRLRIRRSRSWLQCTSSCGGLRAQVAE